MTETDDVGVRLERVEEPAELADTARVSFAPLAIVPGTRYRIDEWLGEGGSGVVYRATHIDIDRVVALKVLSPRERPAAEREPDFRREAQLASKIGSPFICQLYDFDRLSDGRLVIAMEYADGGSLVPLATAGALEPARLIGFMRQICKALHDAHREGIVHRDIKPENVLLSRDRDDHVKLVDFGIGTIGDVPTSGRLSGTPYYMAPEQIRRKPCDGRTDLYALGCTAYELVMGKPPFKKASVKAVLKAHLSENPPPLDPDRIPRPLAEVIERCMAKELEDRFASAAELEAAICEAQIAARLTTPWDDLPLPEVDEERRASLEERMPRKHRKRRWLWPALAGVLALISVVLLVALLRAPEPTAEESAVVEQLSTAAHEAAARAYFVYPGLEHPEVGTAYTYVLELESLDGSLAEPGREAAGALRDEFADTLVRLGNDYWDRVGGRPFAGDYYAQAVVFRPDDERARGRMLLTPGELAMLRTKAEALDFTATELEVAQKLQAIARGEADPAQEVAANRARSRKPRPDTPPPQPATPAERLEPAEPATNVSERLEPAEPATNVSERREPASDVPEPPPKRDPARAKALTANADAARRRGRQKEAAALYHQALAASPRHAAAMYGLAEVAFEQGKYPAAKSWARKAVSAAPGRARYRLTYGDALYKVQDFAAARQQYEKAKALGSKEASARLRRLDKRQGAK